MKIVTFGRHNNNEVIINDAKVSRNHFQIIWDDNGNFILADLNSTNGTYVNGKRITGKVYLNPNDTVRAGDISIVWQEYFLQQPATPPVAPQPPKRTSPLLPPSPPPPPSRIETKLIIAAAIVVLLLIGGGSAMFFSGKLKKAKIETEVEQKVEAEAKAQAERKQNELKKIQSNIDSLRRIANDARIKALESKSEKDEAAAKKAQKAADNAQAEADKKALELAEANAKIKDLKKETEKLSGEKKELEEEKEKLRQSLTQKEKDAQAALAKEQQAKAEAQKKAELTVEFYSQFSKLNKNDFKSVCKELKYDVPNNKDAREVIKEKFDRANNTEKQKIIEAVKKVSPVADKAKQTYQSTTPADTAAKTPEP
jgi:hypothetical protein